MGAFEDFVNNELPLRISNNEDDGTGNLPQGKILLTTGVGKGVETADLPAPTPFIGYIDVTYAQLRDLIDDSTLVPGKWYRITDYRTINDAGMRQVHTAPIEEILVQAITDNQISINAVSQSHINDIIFYDVFDDTIYGNTFIEYEDGVQLTGEVTISNVTTSTFDLDAEPILNGTFYVASESDSMGDVEYEADGEGTDFTLTEVSPGIWRFTDLTGDACFDDPDYVFIEMEFDYRIASRPGKITYRKCTEKHIEFQFDFRNCRFARALIDVSGVQTWSAGTTYTMNSTVFHNGAIWGSMRDDNVGNTPVTSQDAWCLLLSDIDKTHYASTLDGASYGQAWLPTLTSSIELLPVLGNLRGGNFEYDDSEAGYINVKGTNIVFCNYTGPPYIYNVLVKREDSEGSSFYGPVQNLICNGRINNVRTGAGVTFNNVKINISLAKCVFSGYMRTAEFNEVSSCGFNNCVLINVEQATNSYIHRGTRISVGGMNHHLRISGYNIFVASYNRYVCLPEADYVDIGNNNYQLHFYPSSSMLYCSFGNSNKYLKFTGHTLRNISFGSNNGRATAFTLFNGNVIGLKVGNDCFYSGTSGPFNTIQNTILEGNNARLHISSQFVDCRLGIGVCDITCTTLRRVEFGAGTRGITMTGASSAIEDCIFNSGCQNIQNTTPGTFRNNIIRTSNVDFGAAATHAMSNYWCTIISRPDGTKRLTYIDDTDSLVAVDPAS